MTTIVTKNGSGAPLASDLVQGELAVDLTNKRLYTEDSGGTVIEVGSNPTSLTTGTFTSTGIDDNATSTAITIDSSQNVSLAGDLAVDTNTLYVNSTNNRVGIGTASPGANLTVSGANTTADSGNLYVYTSDSAAGDKGGVLSLGGYYSGTALEVAFGRIKGKYTGSGTNGYLAFDTLQSGTISEAMRIDSSGNVGIGTASPADELHINASSTNVNLRLTRDTNTGAKISGSDGASTPVIKFDTIASGTATERMRIDSSGNVGIGTTPNQQGSTRTLHVQSNNGVTLKLENGTEEFDIQSVSGVGALVTRAANPISFYTNSIERMRIDAVGNLLVGTTSLSNGTSSYGTSFENQSKGRMTPRIASNDTGSTRIVEFYNPNGRVGGIFTNGSTTTYETSSDVRLKENIVDADSFDITTIKVRKFDWKVDGRHQSYGFIAQELYEVFPDAVAQGEDEEDTWGVDYSKLVPMLVKEIQDLRARVAQLEEA